MATNRAELALAYHQRGYNCAQSVLASFGDKTGLSEREALAVASGFGKGIGSGEELCGAFGGAVMVLGLMEYHPGQDPSEEKKRMYQQTCELKERFRRRFGMLRCNELLAAGKGPGRPCGALIEAAVVITEEYIMESTL
ncbi:C_GCAxxG_C_C family protein [Oscillibacter hominis]|uniref:C_GCAxxG_C_C family protein n=1 Tax=Oscillibacter hominis TaxID=2763056 RepID=A0A7G9B7J2_9FIRM|nr:C-GCAxxG-C-C family protein [Oscillibacter hominis]QNL45523.1 C_GCAxxG_C_C family protein [Oscillibacter hominis]